MTKVNPVRVGHPRSFLAGGLWVFSSLLAVGWALFGYNLSSTVSFASTQSENPMLAQFGVAFLVLIGSGLMLARYTRLGGAINILGGFATFGIGVLHARGGAISQNRQSQSHSPPILPSLHRTSSNTG